jgi:hypothetical protein
MDMTVGKEGQDVRASFTTPAEAAALSAAKRRAVASKMKIKRRPTREQKSSRNLIHRQDL